MIKFHNQKSIINDQSLQEDLSCPVCQKPLSIPPSIKSTGIEGNGRQAALMRFNLRQSTHGKNKEATLIVSALCGHLFHKFCLRHYCYIYKQTGSSSSCDRIECPLCFQTISMTKVHTVDYIPHLLPSPGIEKDYRIVTLMNKELSDQRNVAMKKLKELTGTLSDAKRKLQVYSDHGIQITKGIDIKKDANELHKTMYNEIGECNRGIDIMHRENIQLIKMYLNIQMNRTEMQGKPHEFLYKKRIPYPLIPYLTIIQGEEKLMRKFGEILRPVEMDGLRSNTELLIQEILADVEPMAKQRKEIVEKKVANLPKHFKLKRDKKNPVVVKVQRSSVSIFSRNELNEESLQQIMKHVKDPIKKLRNAHEKIKPKITELNHRSASEIQVLLEPKKRHVSKTTPGRLDDSKFNMRNLVPIRRCKSTEPILIKNCNKGLKVLVVKLDDIKPDDVAGRTKDQESVKQLNQLEVNEEKVPISSKHPIIKVVQGEDLDSTLKSNNVESESKISQGDRETEKSTESTKHELIKTESVGFEAQPKGSVLEFILQSMMEEEEEENRSAPSLLEQVSAELTFRNKKSSRFDYSINSSEDHLSTSGVVEIEYKIDKQGNIEIPSSNTQSHLKIPEDLDVEKGWLRKETMNNEITGTETDLDSNRNYGVLRGILPGPYSIPSSKSTPPQIPQTERQIPVYLSKWLKNLPSSRNNPVFQKNNCVKRLSPPPLSFLPSPRMVLPPLPKTPESLSMNYPNFLQNCPYGDTIEIKVPQRKASSTTFLNSKHVVIDMPNSNERFNSSQKSSNYRINQTHRSTESLRWMSGFMECPGPCPSRRSSRVYQQEPRYYQTENIQRESYSTLPPLPGESLQPKTSRNFRQRPIYCRSNQFIPQPMGVKILVQPTFSTAQVPSPKSSRRKIVLMDPNGYQLQQQYEPMQSRTHVRYSSERLTSEPMSHICFPRSSGLISEMGVVKTAIHSLCQRFSPPHTAVHNNNNACKSGYQMNPKDSLEYLRKNESNYLNYGAFKTLKRQNFQLGLGMRNIQSENLWAEPFNTMENNTHNNNQNYSIVQESRSLKRAKRRLNC